MCFPRAAQNVPNSGQMSRNTLQEHKDEKRHRIKPRKKTRVSPQRDPPWYDVGSENQHCHLTDHSQEQRWQKQSKSTKSGNSLQYFRRDETRDKKRKLFFWRKNKR